MLYLHCDNSVPNDARFLVNSSLDTSNPSQSDLVQLRMAQNGTLNHSLTKN